MTTINKYPPKLAYKPEFDKENGVFIKLKYMSRETKMRLMDKSTVEEVLYTLRAFENKAKDINSPNTKCLEWVCHLSGQQSKRQMGQIGSNKTQQCF